ncbi:MAG: winged helix-turn-helix domain-containing protein [Candidatus Saliniplasma sp.]
MKKDVKVVRDPKAIKIAVEDTRSNILSLLRINDMSISQLAESLDKDQSTIYRHIKKLEEFGYLEPSGEKKTHHIPEKIYGRTAGVFLLCPSNIDTGQPSDMMVEWERNKAERILELLNVMDYKSEDGEELVEDISDIFIDLKERVTNPIEKSEDEIGKISFATLLRLELLLFLLEQRNDEELKKKVDSVLDKFVQ